VVILFVLNPSLPRFFTTKGHNSLLSIKIANDNSKYMILIITLNQD